MRSWSDGRLVRAARDGSVDAAGELFARHWRGAWRAAYALTGRRAMADDVAQDAFERALAALSRFDDRRPFAPWLHRIVVNRSLDLLRSERRLVGPDAARETGEWDDPRLGDRALLEAVRGVSGQRRGVLVLPLRVRDPPPPIAQLLGGPVGTPHPPPP